MSKGISFIKPPTLISDNMIFIGLSTFESGNEAFPDTTFVPTGIQQVFIILPIVEMPFNRNLCGIRCPQTELYSRGILQDYFVASEAFIETIMGAVLKITNVIISQ
jgi:hypothetical protein